MTFMANLDGFPGIRTDTGAFLWRDGLVAELAKVSEVGSVRGGVALVQLNATVPEESAIYAGTGVP
jgi:hypothetical protein